MGDDVGSRVKRVEVGVSGLEFLVVVKVNVGDTPSPCVDDSAYPESINSPDASASSPKTTGCRDTTSPQLRMTASERI